VRETKACFEIEPTGRIRLTDDDLVYFLHIPRTGGTSFHRVLMRYFDPSTVRHAESRRLVREWIERCSPEELASHRLIAGHYDTSIAALLPKRPRFVTMLREPVARTISHYEILKQMPKNPFHERIVGGDLSLREYLDHPEGGRLDENRQVRQVAGAMDGPTPPGGWTDEALLATAYENLDEFAFFGIRERYDDSLALLAATFGWDLPRVVPHLNASGARTAADHVDDDLRAWIEERNALDVTFYAHARKRFRERQSVLRPGAEAGDAAERPSA
jgi:hypothetical protein